MPVYVLLEEALFALLLLDLAQPAHPAWTIISLSAAVADGGWYKTGNYHQTRNKERRESNYFGKRNLVVSCAPLFNVTALSLCVPASGPSVKVW